MPRQDNLPAPTRTSHLTTAIPQSLLQGVAPNQLTLQPPGTPPIVCGPHSSQGTKRRLGMGRGVVGYVNKKFKVPT